MEERMTLTEEKIAIKLMKLTWYSTTKVGRVLSR